MTRREVRHGVTTVVGPGGVPNGLTFVVRCLDVANLPRVDADPAERAYLVIGRANIVPPTGPWRGAPILGSRG